MLSVPCMTYDVTSPGTSLTLDCHGTACENIQGESVRYRTGLDKNSRACLDLTNPPEVYCGSSKVEPEIKDVLEGESNSRLYSFGLGNWSPNNFYSLDSSNLSAGLLLSEHSRKHAWLFHLPNGAARGESSP